MKDSVELSVIIITHNEEHVIRDCLESVKWAHEIIVVDSHSTDSTIDIAREYTDKIYSRDWPGFGKQKNIALSFATKQWVLSIDADEMVSDNLRDEIIRVLRCDNRCSAFKIPFDLFLFGKRIKYGVTLNEKHVRLFRRDSAKFDENIVHENIEVSGSIGKLKYSIKHFSSDSIEEMIEKMNRYSSDGAEAMKSLNKNGGIIKAIVHAFWMFLKIYFIKFGFVDGKLGFIRAISNSECSFYKYIKLGF